MSKREDEMLQLWTRVLIGVAKAVSTRSAVSRVFEAMTVFGGNGVEERFCALPRLWRDAAALETWEGPYTLLLTRALEDLAKYGVRGREEAFLLFGLGEYVDCDDTRELAEILAAPNTSESIVRWGELAPRLYARFEEKASAELH